MNIPIEHKIGQMIQTGFRGFTVEAGSHIINDIKKHHVGFIVLFDYDEESGEYHRNIQTPEQVKALTSSLKEMADYPLFITIDQEGGKVNRLKSEYGFPETHSAHFLGEKNDPAYTFRHASLIAGTLSEAGIDLNLAPVLDLALNSVNPIIAGKERSFSADPEHVIIHAREYIKAHREMSVKTAVKHFPGHGSSSSDTHLGMVDVTHMWKEIELIPYRELIAGGLVDMVMTTHVFNTRLDEEYPATLSKKILTGILREELGFNGVVMTDDLQMKAIRDHYGFEHAVELAILAGADVINVGNNMEYWPESTERIAGIIKSLLEKGTISEEWIGESFERIKRLKGI
jgi:beta-N-acetylhexosaminidase